MNESELRQVIREELETVLRRVVHEELRALLASGLVSPEPVAATRPKLLSLEEYLTSFEHPFALSEVELQQVESILPPAEGEIYRQRVYAFRAARSGNQKAAARLRKKADRMEQDLMARRADKRIS